MSDARRIAVFNRLRQEPNCGPLMATAIAEAIELALDFQEPPAGCPYDEECQHGCVSFRAHDQRVNPCPLKWHDHCEHIWRW